MTLLAAALDLHQAGYSVIPIRPDGTKAPAVAWKQYTQQAASPEQVDTWLRDTTHDIAVIQGAVSGGAELTELEAAATPHLPEIITTLTEQGLGGLWQTLTTGWVESSPSGGLHLHYRLAETVPGNTKIAADSDHRTLAETRGEGGYVIVAPSQHHPSGKAWTRLTGGPTTTPTITREQRDQLHAALRDVLHREPEAATPAPRPTPTPRNGDNVTPGDDFEARTTWDEILGPHGWTRTRQDGSGWAWTRPGKNPREGISATTGKDPERDRLYVFSSSTEFTPDTPYTKFGAHALLNHSGDHTAAARQLAKDGYGTPNEPHMDLTGLPTTPTRTAATVAGNLATVTPLPAPNQRALAAAPGSTLQHSDDANALKLVDAHGQEIRYVTDRGRWITWNGHRWEWAPASGGHVREYAKKVARGLPEDNEKALTHKKRSLSAVGTTAMILQAETDDRITIPLDDLDAHGHELNTPAGIVNLRTGQIDPPDPARLHTRSTAVSPDSARPTPRWDAFLADTFAGQDPDVLPFLQRLVGYSATGTVTHHVLPFLHGPGGNGKSVFLDVLRALLGDYAGSAPARFLMAGPTQHETEIARLSGLRFVVASEINQNDKFDEAKVKLLTGGDALTARFMRQDHFTFTPTHHLWLMGNHQPKVESGGESFWRRLRLVGFTNTVPDDKKIDNLAETLITEEGPGILAWVIQGAIDALASGINAPESVMAETAQYASEEDALSRFITDRCVIVDSPAAQTTTSALYADYTRWCAREGEKPLDARWLGRELRTKHGIQTGRTKSSRYYQGILLAEKPASNDVIDDVMPDSTDELRWDQW